MGPVEPISVGRAATQTQLGVRRTEPAVVLSAVCAVTRGLCRGCGDGERRGGVGVSVNWAVEGSSAGPHLPS